MCDFTEEYAKLFVLDAALQAFSEEPMFQAQMDEFFKPLVQWSLKVRCDAQKSAASALRGGSSPFKTNFKEKIAVNLARDILNLAYDHAEAQGLPVRRDSPQDLEQLYGELLKKEEAKSEAVKNSRRRKSDNDGIQAQIMDEDSELDAPAPSASSALESTSNFKGPLNAHIISQAALSQMN